VLAASASRSRPAGATDEPVRLTRHARNRMRLYGVNRNEVAEVVARRAQVDRDVSGNSVITGEVGGRSLAVIVAADDPNLVITLHPED
jgi:hypothetical protein